MKRLFSASLCFLAGVVGVVAGVQPQLDSVFQDDDHQFTGVAISKTRRMFINYPRWQSAHDYDVIEMRDGVRIPFPNSKDALVQQRTKQTHHALYDLQNQPPRGGPIARKTKV